MTPETDAPKELTPEQLEMAEFYIEECGLRDFADDDLEMMGASGTVRYGLGRCAKYLQDNTPEEIREMVLTKLAAQQAGGADGPAA